MRKSIRTVALGVILALTVLGMPSIALADAISVGDGWHEFTWVGGPNAVQTQSAFTFTTASAVTVQVTDAYLYGDRFQLSDNGAVVGLTSLPTHNTSVPITTDPDAAFAGVFSKGSFTLAAGSHSLILKNIQIPNNIDSGGAFVRVVSGDGTGVVAEVAPEPSSLALVGMGLAGLALRRRLRRGKAAQPEIAIA